MSEWQPTHGGKYEVSRSGRVRVSGGRELKLWASDQGYMLARLSSPRTVARVHRLVAMAFVQNTLALPTVNHIDCNRANNNADNLEWCTQAGNIRRAAQLGRMSTHWKGKRSPNAGLSDATVAAMRADIEQRRLSYQSLADKYGISKRTVGRAIKGETYAE